MNTENEGETAQPGFRLRRGFLTWPTPAGSLGEAAFHPSSAGTASR
jgi:hypothetical protein